MIDLEAIKGRQQRFACFCADTSWEPPIDVDGGEHHPECMSTDINTDVRDLLAEVEHLKGVLEYYADRNVWRDNQIDSDDCSAVTVYGSHVSLDFTEIVGGKRAREALEQSR